MAFNYPPAIKLDAIELKDDVSADPRLVMMRTVEIAIPPAMRPNSMPVTPDWSLRKRGGFITRSTD
jgi:hypothetical protein